MQYCICASACGTFTRNLRKHEELHMRPRGRRLAWMIPLGIVGMALFIFVGGEIVKLLWNWLLPPLFGWREITFWQGLGILLLCRILFGHHGWRGGPRYVARRRIRERMYERWQQMTP